MRDWKRISQGDLPPVGATVLLMDVTDVLGDKPELAIATHALDEDGQPPETYWRIWHDGNQHAIFEKWTHWTLLMLPTKRVLKLLAEEIRKERRSA